MTELSIRDDNTPDQQQPQDPAQSAPTNMSELAQWAQDARQANIISESIAKTSFVPDSYQRNPHNVTAAILTGQELGLPPMASLRALDIIYGVPALRAHAMRGLLQSRGHSVQLVESSDTRCVMRGRRKGEEDWQTVTWTIDRAAKLLGGLKNQWVKQPQTMLIARATGEICRLIAADVLYAAPYAAEELDGDGRPEPTYRAEPVTAAEILDDDGPGEKADPDADAAEQAAAEADEQDPWMVPAGGDR
ncbi:hypothetical protein BJF79_46205 [Actinomadura sp. CNU-125]|uniref:hypothetical protein n=1 Tax=Actinomadura sp. CNU-125 TaxID=1904961 RepID=UPI00096A0DC5|nr:hypothetical protein [Actinomadura sp. CNU-125]OLT22879.1 hypothetical protein BJF79_46205 [Actinomadura sp. CNU-125]